MNNETLYIVCPNPKISKTLKSMIEACTTSCESKFADDFNSFDYTNKKLLFCVELNSIGVDMAMLMLLEKLNSLGSTSLSGSTSAIIIHSPNDLNTKRAAQDIIFSLNNLGSAFIGHPVVEATSSLGNFITWQKTLKLSLMDICLTMCKKLVSELIGEKEASKKASEILVLYSTPHLKSNTIALWNMVKKELSSYSIKEVNIENGEVLDCKGCSYKTCLHYGEHNSCFYGGIMVKNILPAIERSNTIIWLCPNYNDGINANLTAVINRLTVLYHKISFKDKKTYAIVVSGNSGSDSVAKQLIGAANINKGFYLPPYATLLETANDPGAIYKVSGIEEKAHNFAEGIKREL